MATLKQVIFNVLKETGLPAAYRFSDISQMPRFSYSLVYNGELRLSGKTHERKPTYQIDYFSRVPVDIEAFPLFDNVRDQLRSQNIAVGNWQEAEDYDDSTDRMVYHYYMECEK